jgi:hypothetical protein
MEVAMMARQAWPEGVASQSLKVARKEEAGAVAVPAVAAAAAVAVAAAAVAAAGDSMVMAGTEVVAVEEEGRLGAVEAVEEAGEALSTTGEAADLEAATTTAVAVDDADSRRCYEQQAFFS